MVVGKECNVFCRATGEKEMLKFALHKGRFAVNPALFRWKRDLVPGFHGRRELYASVEQLSVVANGRGPCGSHLEFERIGGIIWNES